MKYIVFLCSLFAVSLYSSTSVEAAVEKYAAAERATAVSEKNILLNQALTVFLHLDNEEASGQLLYNIGNVYFSLGDLGKAIAYYRRAEQSMPRDGRVIANLTAAIEKADVEGKQIHKGLADFLGIRWLSSYERRLLVLGAGLLSLILFSLNLWLPGYGFRSLWWMSIFGTICIVSALCIYAFVVPVRAIVIQQTPLQKEGTEIKKEPAILLPGEMVEVLNFDSNKQYSYVKSSMNVQGLIKVADLVFLTE